MTLYRQVLRIAAGSPLATDIYRLHQAVMTGWRHVLEDDADQQRARHDILFAAARKPRRYQAPAGPVMQVLVQASSEPDWEGSYFAEHLRAAAPAFRYDPPPLATGDRIGVAVTVHATHTVARRRRPITQPAEVLAWTAERLADAALLDTDGATVSHDGYATGSRASNIPFHTITSTATLANPDALTRHLAHGIGRAKAFGGGLLRIRPLP